MLLSADAGRNMRCKPSLPPSGIPAGPSWPCKACTLPCFTPVKWYLCLPF